MKRALLLLFLVMAARDVRAQGSPDGVDCATQEPTGSAPAPPLLWFPNHGRVNAIVVFMAAPDEREQCSDATDRDEYGIPRDITDTHPYPTTCGLTPGDDEQYQSYSDDPLTEWPAVYTAGELPLPPWAAGFVAAPGTAPANYAPGSLSDYYWTMSGGRFRLEGVVYPRTVVTERAWDAYGDNFTRITPIAEEVIREIASDASFEIDYGLYDRFINGTNVYGADITGPEGGPDGEPDGDFASSGSGKLDMLILVGRSRIQGIANFGVAQFTSPIFLNSPRGPIQVVQQTSYQGVSGVVAHSDRGSREWAISLTAHEIGHHQFSLGHENNQNSFGLMWSHDWVGMAATNRMELGWVNVRNVAVPPTSAVPQTIGDAFLSGEVVCVTVNNCQSVGDIIIEARGASSYWSRPGVMMADHDWRDSIATSEPGLQVYRRTGSSVYGYQSMERTGRTVRDHRSFRRFGPSGRPLTYVPGADYAPSSRFAFSVPSGDPNNYRGRVGVSGIAPVLGGYSFTLIGNHTEATHPRAVMPASLSEGTSLARSDVWTIGGELTLAGLTDPVGSSDAAISLAPSARLVVPSASLLDLRGTSSRSLPVAGATGSSIVIRGMLLTDLTTMTATSPSQPWKGIVLEAGSATLTNTTVEHTDIGVTVYDPAWLHTDGSTFQHNRIGIDVLSPLDGGNQNRFEATTFNSNGVAVRSDFSECVGMTCSCFGACRSGFSVTNSCVLSSTVALDEGRGIWAQNADARVVGTTILENDAIGVRAENAEVRLGDARVAFNGYGDGGPFDGVQAAADAEIRLFDVFDAQTGGNAVHQNAAHEVAGVPNSFVVLGAAFLPSNPPPSNSVWKTTAPGPGSRYVANGDNSYTLQAQRVWWNSSLGPPAGAFEGLVAWAPFATTDAAGGAGNDNCQTPGSFSETGAARVDLPPVDRAGSVRGEVENAGLLQGLDEMAEAITGLRAAIQANPFGAQAARLVAELYALQRLDRDDVLGERAATLELLGSLRGHLDLPELPAGAREPAEAALSAEVAEALLREDYALAAGLLSGPGRRVEGPEARRRLRYAELTLDLQVRRFDSALARIDTLLTALPEALESERRGLLARARVIEERQATRSAAHAVLPDAATNGSTAGGSSADPQLGAPQPNPAAGSARLVLELPEAAVVRSEVFDVVGRRVSVLADGALVPGRHILRVDASALGSGLYVVRTTVASSAGTRVLAQRLTVLR
jgi:hypothetical protein